MRKNYVNYLLSACVEAKNAELAYTTILKYSNPEYVANQIYLSKINLSTDSQPAAENVGTVIDPAAKTEKHNLTGSAADKKDRNLEGRKSKKAGTKMEFYTPFLRPDSYLIALNACGSCGDPATANRILQVMTVQGIPIDVDSWNAVLNAVRHLLTSDKRCVHRVASSCAASVPFLTPGNVLGHCRNCAPLLG